MLTELRDGVWWLECTGVNAYLIEDGDGVTLVDAGTPFDAAKIEAAIDTAGFDREDIQRILLTHYDIDHVGAAAKLSVDAPVYVGSADADYVTGKRRPRVRSAKTLVQFLAGPLIPTLSDSRIRRVEDGDDIGGFSAIHAPGHTPGHTVYVHEGRETALLGDLVIERDGKLRASPWYLSYDTNAVEDSIRKVNARTDSIEMAAMGHGTPFMREGSRRLREAANGE